MKRLLYPLALYFIITLPYNGYCEVVIGGKAEINYSILLNTGQLGKSVPDLRTSFDPSLSAYSSIFEFSIIGSISYSKASMTPEGQLKLFEIILNPSDFLTARIGRFPYLPGTAEFISPTNYFSRIDYEKLLSGSITDYIVANDIVQLGFFLGNYYVNLSLAPFAGEFILPETDSYWFPKKDIPDSITVTFPSQQTMWLENLYYGDPEYPPVTLDNISFSAEAGGTVSILDFSLIYYHGTDNTPLMRGEIYFPQGLFENYDVIITPHYRIIDAIGINLAANISSLRIWADSSFTFSKTFNTNRLSSTNFTTELAQSPYLEYSLGCSYEHYFINWNFFLLAEYKDNLIVERKEYFIDNMLSSLILGTADFRFFDDKLSSIFTFIHSIKDGSTVFVLKLSYSPSDELEFILQNPLFLGESKSDFGQFRDNHLFSCGVILRF